MSLDAAPYFAAVAEGPDNARVFWARAADGLRIRLAHWPADDAARGTVLLLPGRTEYVEKYGRTAQDLVARGFDVLCIDWRGQGLADRLLDDPRRGHVLTFGDYQADLDAMIAAAGALDLPQPFCMLAHSMGGCIGLRGLMRGLPIDRVAFTGPMWGIRIAAHIRPAAWALSWGSGLLGLGHAYAPGTGAGSYVASEPFAGNLLTGDAEMFDYMRRQVTAHPELQLGGPSLRWLHAALIETRAMARLPSPPQPCLTFLGSDERIIDTARVGQRINCWPNASLEVIEGGKHEVLMASRAIRTRIADALAEHFTASSDGDGARLTA